MNMQPIRRKERALTEEKALEVMQNALFATISCIAPDGQPYGVTVSHAVENRTIYFHCAMQGFKVDCFAAHPQVCVSAVEQAQTNAPKLTVNYRSAVAFGAIRVAEGEEAVHGLRVIGQKFTPAHMPAVEDCIEKSMGRTRIYAIDIERITGKGNA